MQPPVRLTPCLCCDWRLTWRNTNKVPMPKVKRKLIKPNHTSNLLDNTLRLNQACVPHKWWGKAANVGSNAQKPGKRRSGLMNTMHQSATRANPPKLLDCCEWVVSHWVAAGRCVSHTLTPNLPTAPKTVWLGEKKWPPLRCTSPWRYWPAMVDEKQTKHTLSKLTCFFQATKQSKAKQCSTALSILKTTGATMVWV